MTKKTLTLFVLVAMLPSVLHGDDTRKPKKPKDTAEIWSDDALIDGVWKGTLYMHTDGKDSKAKKDDQREYPIQLVCEMEPKSQRNPYRFLTVTYRLADGPQRVFGVADGFVGCVPHLYFDPSRTQDGNLVGYFTRLPWGLGDVKPDTEDTANVEAEYENSILTIQVTPKGRDSWLAKLVLEKTSEKQDE